MIPLTLTTVLRRRVIILTLMIFMLSIAYVVGRRSVKPIREVVDREIVRVVERLIPGEVRTVFRDVPGPTRTEVVRVPVEVTRIVREVGPERIVTVTRPVDVPIEVIRETWPQTITVRVGSVLSGGLWYVPDHQELVLGQIALGVYAVSALSVGWKVESVKTETRLDPNAPLPQPLFQSGFTVGIRTNMQSVWGDIVYRNLAWGGEYSVRAPVISLNGGPMWMLIWDVRR